MELGLPPSPQSKSASATPPLVPTPPAEVFIRTLESDLQSLRASGGARPKANRVVLSKSAEGEKRPRVSWLASRNIEVRWLLLAAMAALAFGGLVLYAVSHFSLPFPGSPAAVPSSSPLAAGESAESSGTTSGLEDLSSPRKEIFRKPLERSVSFVAGGVVREASDLKTPVQRFREALGGLPAVSTPALIQVVPTDDTNMPEPLSQFFTLMDMNVLDPQFVKTHFEEGFGMFAYLDKAGWWPGYVLALKPGENWLFLKEEISALEESPKVQNFYLAPPGSPKAGFREARIGDVSARMLEWSSGASFIYGWFRGYLVISTSQAGLEAVLPRL